MLGPLVRAALLTLLILGLGYTLFFWIGMPDPTARHVVLIIISFLFLIVQWNFIQRFYCHFLNIVIVTSRKIHVIKKNLLSLDSHQSIDLWALQDIKKSQRGPIQNIFGFGSIILEAQDTQLRLHFCPRVQHHYEAFLHLMEDGRQEVNRAL